MEAAALRSLGEGGRGRGWRDTRFGFAMDRLPSRAQSYHGFDEMEGGVTGRLRISRPTASSKRRSIYLARISHEWCGQPLARCATVQRYVPRRRA